MANDALAASHVRRGRRGSRRGYLVPGGPPPVAGDGGYYDYRGVLDIKRVPDELIDTPFPLGRYFSPSHGQRSPIGLPEEVVAHHVVLIGRTGAGKTTSIIVPWMESALRAGWSVVCVDIKGDLLERVQRESGHTLGNRAKAFDYARGATSLSWNWLGELDSDRAIDNAVTSVLGRKAPPGTDPFYHNMDSQILRGMLELVAATRHPERITTQKMLAMLQDQQRLRAALQTTKSVQARRRLSGIVADDPLDYAKRIHGVITRLDPLARASVDAVTSRCDFRAADLLDNSVLLSIVAPAQDGQLAEMFSSLLINQILYRAYERFRAYRGLPLLLVLDEAARLTDRIDLEQVLSVARAAGVAVVIALQDADQLTDQSQRSVIFANAGTVICTSGISSTTAKLMSGRLGMHPMSSTAISTGPYIHGQGHGPNLSTTSSMVPVLGEREIMSPPFGDRLACVHARDISTAPFFVDLAR